MLFKAFLKNIILGALHVEVLLPHLKFRNGIHLGDVTIDSGHIHSDGVKIFRTPPPSRAIVESDSVEGS
jgi:hypothetical protein